MIRIERDAMLQDVLDYIEANIKNELTADMIAERAGYSVFHFGRLFAEAAGDTVMSYVTKRRLRHALTDLSNGMKVIDAAMEYGFETHAGFTKAFTKRYGFPPSICRLRINAAPPARVVAEKIKNNYIGGNEMHPHIIELTPFDVVGYPTRHISGGVKKTADAPTYWNTIDLDYGPLLTKLYEKFTKSKHCEISMCYDADDATGEFTYMLGRGIDNPDDLQNIEPDMTRVTIPGGLYAIFPTPPAFETYIEAAGKTWNDALLHWLPGSEFCYDETRHGFEYHDHRDHGWYFGGRLQIDVCVPIRQREEETVKSKRRADRID